MVEYELLRASTSYPSAEKVEDAKEQDDAHGDDT